MDYADERKPPLHMVTDIARHTNDTRLFEKPGVGAGPKNPTRDVGSRREGCFVGLQSLYSTDGGGPFRGQARQ